MTSSANNEDIVINSLVDNELDHDERAALLAQLDNNPQLQNDLCDVRRIKDMLKMAYPDTSIGSPVTNSQPKNWLGAVSASILLLVVGFGLGDYFSLKPEVQPFNLSQVTANNQKLVLFIGTSDDAKFEKTLSQAEYFLKTNHDKNVQVNVVTSAGGIDLLNKEKSKFLPRINQLSKKYDSLSFIACNATIQRLKREGRSIAIIDEALVSPTAVQFVVNRLQQGWSYVAI